MSFYKALYPFYDKIFPLNQQAASFMLANFNKGESLLDVGAGTGNMAIALAKEGLKVTALEPEQDMANDIVVKASTEGVPLEVLAYSMEQIEQLSIQYDGIYCVGNTLPHLQSIEDIQTFLEECSRKLKQGGKLVIQTVNFEKFFASSDFSFPLISKEEFTFHRKYEEQGEKVLFTATLTMDGTSVSNSIPLSPITSEMLVPLLEKAGFTDIQLLGNFKGEPYSVDSPAFIVVAKAK